MQAMFCQTGHIVDSFISVNKSTGLGRGFAFVKFGFMEEAKMAIANVNGRSWVGWGSRKIQVNPARHISTKVNALFSSSQTAKAISLFCPNS